MNDFYIDEIMRMASEQASKIERQKEEQLDARIRRIVREEIMMERERQRQQRMAII